MNGICFLVAILFYCCSCHEESPYFLPEIIDYPHIGQSDPVFKHADSLRYSLNYPAAAKAYEALLRAPIEKAGRLYALQQLAGCHLMLNQDSLARYFLDKALEEFPDTLSMPAPALADWSFDQALLAYHDFLPGKAVWYFKKAARLYQKCYPKGHLRIGQCWAFLTLALIDFKGTPDSVFKYGDLSRRHFQNNLLLRKYCKEGELAEAAVCIWKRSHEESQAHADLALELASEAPWKDTLFMAWCLNVKGQALKKRGQNETDTLQRHRFFKLADSAYRQAAAWAKTSSNCRLQQIYRDWANNCVWLNDTSTFFSILHTLDSMLETQPDRYAMPDWLRAYYYHKIGDYNKAIFWAKIFEKRYRHSPLRAHIYYQNSLYILMESSIGLQDYDAALQYCIDFALSDTPMEGKNLGIADMFLPEVYQSFPYPAMQFDRMGQILWKKHRKKPGSVDLGQLLEIYLLVDELLFPSIRSLDEDAVLTFQKEIGEKAFQLGLQVAWHLYQSSKEPAYLDVAFRFSERMKSVLLFRNMNSASPTSAAPPQPLLDSLQRLHAHINHLKWLREQGRPFEGKNPALELTAAQGQFERLYTRASTRFPGFFHEKISHPVPSVEAVRASLGPGQCMVHYYLGDQYLHALYFDRDTVLFEQVDSAETLVEQVLEFRNCLAKPQPGDGAAKNYERLASLLYVRLLGQFGERFSKQNELLVVPDKILQLIPFEALLEPSDEPWQGYRKAPYLLHRLQVAYSPSWKVYENKRGMSRLPAQPRILAMTYGNERGEGALPYARREVETIRAIFGNKQVEVLMGSACSKKNFLKQQPGFDILHLSLHAASSLHDRRDNKVFFQLPNRDTLYGFELMEHGIKASLVVLSACETGFGRTEGGEGAYSLSRYFLQAGAKSVAASLWKIDDAATSRLMGYFYEGLRKGLAPHASLHAAKIKFLKTAETDFVAGPGMWAGVVGQ